MQDASRDWATLSHEEFKQELGAGLAERERRMQELMGIVAAEAPRGSGRPPKHDMRTRAGQLAAAAESEAVQ